MTVGTFDGVHRGHRAVLDCAVAAARESGGDAVAVTFDRHPLELVAPERAPRLLMDPDRRDMAIRNAGVKAVRVAFTPELCALTAAEWLARLRDEYGAGTVVVGYDNTFGCDGVDKSLEDYRLLGWEAGLTVVAAPVVPDVSSSAIRRAVQEGDVARAAEMLGHPFSISGTVVAGRKIGRTIGIPTANVLPCARQQMPATGVYSAEARLGRDSYTALVNVGYRPTVGKVSELTVEAHLLGFDGDIYGREAVLDFTGRIRDERRFGNLDELRDQILHDIESVKGR